MKALVSVGLAASLGLAGCTTVTFDQNVRDNLGRACVAWTSIYGLFQQAALGGQIPMTAVARVEQANVAAGTFCAQRESITDVYTAASAVIAAYNAVLIEMRRAGISADETL